MQVTDHIMYHFHNNKFHNELWVPDSEIIVDDNFDTEFLKILRYFSTAVNLTEGGRKSFDHIIDNYLKVKQDEKMLIDMLKEARRIIYEMNIFKRELALEEIRAEKHPELPSRKHSIWLCNENGIDFWQTQISQKGEQPPQLFKVSVTGNLFKSSDSFIPDDDINFETSLAAAERYWNPNFETEEQEKKAEYLFQGRVKVLEKININKD